jgi:alanine racemase
MNSETYRCWAEIEQKALQHNAEAVSRWLGGRVELLAVIKANGYGHGMIGVAKALERTVQFFGVANLEEATVLRGQVAQPITILGPALPEEHRAIAEGGFIPSISTYEEAEDFDRVAAGNPVAINLVVDTGMGRVGVLETGAVALFKRISQLANIKISSLSTHLPVANEDSEFTEAELGRFGVIVEKIRAEVPGSNHKVHVLASGGALAFANVPFDIVRAGLMLYGVSPLSEFQKLVRPALTWKTRICLIRDMPADHGISYGRTFITPRPMRVATLSAGYADGYPRHLSGQDAAVLVRGQRCPLLGRVTMDLIMIDVSNAGAQVGDEIVLMGRQGGEEISAVELADRAGTIPWEILTGIGPRVRRVYV